jgi:hypothetical protein
MKEWKVNWPPNAKLIVSTIETIALGKLIDKEKIKQKIMYFYGIPVNFKSQKRQLSASSLRRDRLAFTAAGFAGISALVLLAIILLRRSKFREKLASLVKEVKKQLFWNFFIRSYLQAFLSQSIWIIGYLAVKQEGRVSTNKKALMYTAAFVILGLIPAFLVYLINANFKRLEEG